MHHDRRIDIDIDEQISELSTKLAQVAELRERDLARITDQEISLAAARATKEEALAGLCASLVPAVEQIVPRFVGNPAVSTLADRVRAARQLVILARTPRG